MCIALSYSRVPPRQKPSLIQQTGKAQTPQEPETEDIKTRAQLLLEESAAPVVVEDMEKSKEIIEHGSYETFILMVLTRLQPILFYCLHHDPVEVSYARLIFHTLIHAFFLDSSSKGLRTRNRQ